MQIKWEMELQLSSVLVYPKPSFIWSQNFQTPMYKFKQSSSGYPYFYPLGTNSQYYEKSLDEAGNIQAVDPAQVECSGWLPVGNYSKWLMRTKLRLVPTNKFWFHLSCWQANVIWTKFGVTLLIRPEPSLALALSPHLRSWGPQSRVVTWGLIMSQYTHYIQDSLSVPQSY